MSQPSNDIEIPDDFPIPIDVSGRAVVVTGATRGLGRLLVTAFARSGARLGLVARSEEQLLKTAAALPGEPLVVPGDFRDEVFNQRVARTVADQYSGLDVWIANAGVSPVMQRVESLEVGQWQDVIDTNLTGAFFGARAAASVMQRGGRIIFTSS